MSQYHGPSQLGFMIIAGSMATIYAMVAIMFLFIDPADLSNAPPAPREYLRQQCAELDGCDFFQIDAIATCESHWQMVPNSISSAYGYFQIIDATERITPQYQAGKRKYNPYTNIEMGLYLYMTYGTSPWYPSQHCWYWKQSLVRQSVDGCLGECEG